MEPWSDVARYPAQGVAFWALGRLDPEVSLEAAQARITSLEDPDAAKFPPGVPRVVPRAEPMNDWVMAGTRPSLVLLACVAFSLLLITCATAANALLVRVAATHRELAIRTALGAHASRLRRAIATQAVALAVAGVAGGTLLTAALGPVLRAIVPPTFPRADAIGASSWMFGFAAAVAALTAVLATMLPAWRASRSAPMHAIRTASAKASPDRASTRWRASLVGVQSAIAAVLVAGAVLLSLSLWRLVNVPLGFDARDVMTVEMRMLGPAYRSPERLSALQRELVREVGALPGVLDVGLTSAVPFRGTDFYGQVGRFGDTASTETNIRYVDRAYFSILNIPLLRGRWFAETDATGAEQVALISEQYARAAFGTSDPVGHTIEFDGARTIVGVVRDVRYQSFELDPRPAIYLPRSQRPNALTCLVIRVAPGSNDVAAAVRAAVHRVDPNLPAMRFASIDDILGASVAERRFYTIVVVGFAGAAVLLTLTGVVLVVSRIVIERRGDMAIRAALGASPFNVLALVARAGVAPVIAGVATGLAVVLAGAKLLESFLFGVPSRDPVILTAIGMSLILVGLAAAVVPALRILRMHPSDVLRTD
jgi:predicted permease